MRAYIIRRLLLIIPTLFILSILVFLSVRFIPGDVVDAMVNRMQSYGAATEIDREAIERYLGLGAPVPPSGCQNPRLSRGMPSINSSFSMLIFAIRSSLRLF